MSTRGEWQEVLVDALNHRSLSNQERDFIISLIGRPDDYELSAKQADWLRDIENKIYRTG
jgi:hypothetical protein